MGLPFGRAKVSKAEVRQKLQRRVHRFLNLANLEADFEGWAFLKVHDKNLEIMF